jgi:hypothetical protein
VGATPERLDMEYLNRFSSFQQFRGTEEDMEKGNTASATSPVADLAHRYVMPVNSHTIGLERSWLSSATTPA